MQTYKCNFCLRRLELFSDRPSSGIPNAYLSECLEHIFCESCKTKIYPRCICKPQSRFMAINNRMPERYRSLFVPAQNLNQRIKQIEQFQTNQSRLNFHRMCQYNHRVQGIIDQIERRETIQQRYSQRWKSMRYLIKKR